MNKSPLIRKLYLYLFSAAGLVISIIGLISLVNIGLRIFIFKNADYYSIRPESIKPVNISTSTEFVTDREREKLQVKREREQDAANALAMVIVGLPLYLYHWRVIIKDKEGETNSQLN